MIVRRLSCVILAGLFLAGLVQLGVRLKAVQVDGAADYSYASSRQSVRRVQVGGIRGRILDRNGAVMAGNRSAVSIVCNPSGFQRRTWSGTVEEIATAIDEVAAVVGVRLLDKGRHQSTRQPVAVHASLRMADIGFRSLLSFRNTRRISRLRRGGDG